MKNLIFKVIENIGFCIYEKIVEFFYIAYVDILYMSLIYMSLVILYDFYFFFVEYSSRFLIGCYVLL